jgi:hypothetical protein
MNGGKIRALAQKAAAGSIPPFAAGNAAVFRAAGNIRAMKSLHKGGGALGVARMQS